MDGLGTMIAVASGLSQAGSSERDGEGFFRARRGGRVVVLVAREERPSPGMNQGRLPI